MYPRIVNLHHWRILEGMERFPADSPFVPFVSAEYMPNLNGAEADFTTPGASRPDVVREIDGHLEAIEVENYNLNKEDLVNNLCCTLENQIRDRVVNLPAGSTQRVVLDLKGHTYSNQVVEETIEKIQSQCSDIYPNLPVDTLKY